MTATTPTPQTTGQGGAPAAADQNGAQNPAPAPAANQAGPQNNQQGGAQSNQQGGAQDNQRNNPPAGN